MQAIGNGRSGGFVDKSFDLEACKLRSLFGGLALIVIEVGRYTDDGFSYRFPQKRFGIFLEGTEHQRGEFGGSEGAFGEFDLMVCAHQPLERCYRAITVIDQTLPGGPADDDFPVFVQANNGWGEHLAEPVGDQFDPVLCPYPAGTVSGAQINPDDGHIPSLLCCPTHYEDGHASNRQQFTDS